MVVVVVVVAVEVVLVAIVVLVELVVGGRVYWGHVTSVPTHIADSQEQHTVTYFSQAPEDS